MRLFFFCLAFLWANPACGAADSLYLSVEVRDVDRASIGMVRDTLRIAPFDSSRVALSSILLASSVIEGSDGAVDAVPNPLRTFAGALFVISE